MYFLKSVSSFRCSFKCGLKEIQKNISNLKAFSKIGKDMDLDYNLSVPKSFQSSKDLILYYQNQIINLI